MKRLALLSLLLFFVACQQAPTDTPGVDDESWQNTISADVEPCTNGDCPPDDPPCTNGDCPPDDPPCTNGDCPPDDPPCTNGDCPPDDPPCTNGDCPPDDPPCTNGDCPPDDPPCTNGDCPPDDPPCTNGDCPPDDPPCTNGDCPPPDQADYKHHLVGQGNVWDEWAPDLVINALRKFNGDVAGNLVVPCRGGACPNGIISGAKRGQVVGLVAPGATYDHWCIETALDDVPGIISLVYIRDVGDGNSSLDQVGFGGGHGFTCSQYPTTETGFRNLITGDFKGNVKSK